MKMITLFLPEKHIEMVDTLVTLGVFPNRSEALRTGAWKIINESINVLKRYREAAKNRERPTDGDEPEDKKQPEQDEIDPFDEILSGLEVASNQGL